MGSEMCIRDRGTNAGKNNQGDNGIIISSIEGTVNDATDNHIHIAGGEASLDYTSAGGWSFSSSVAAANVLNVSSLKLTNTGGGATFTSFFGITLVDIALGDVLFLVPPTASTPQRIPFTISKNTGNITAEGSVTGTSFIGSGTSLTGMITLAELKTEVAASADFAAFKLRIAAL